VSRVARVARVARVHRVSSGFIGRGPPVYLLCTSAPTSSHFDLLLISPGGWRAETVLVASLTLSAPNWRKVRRSRERRANAQRPARGKQDDGEGRRSVARGE